MELGDSALIHGLFTSRLPVADYVVTGSGPLLAHGLKKNINDIDLLARGRAWERAARLGTVRRSKSGIGRWISLSGGQIEVFDHWVGGLFDVDAMIDEAEFVEGVPFMSLRETLRWKRSLGRAKDQRDVALIERHLSVPAR
jgi:hypothetical protein